MMRLNAISEEMHDRSAFTQFCIRCDAILQSNANGELIYDTVYARLFGLDGYNDDLKINICILIFLCLLLSPFASQDRKTDMVKNLYATASGKRGYWKHLLIYSAVCRIIVSVIFNVPYVFHILQKYGTVGLSAPLQSMTEFAQNVVIRTVQTEIIMLLFVRIFSAAVTAMCMSLVRRSNELFPHISAKRVNSAFIPLFTFILFDSRHSVSQI